MKREILITGGAGFIGWHLAYRLSQDPENIVTIADNFARGRKDADMETLLARENVRLVTVDLTKRETMGPIWKKYDEVYHLAAIVGVKYCMNHPDRVLYVNTQSTINMIELMKATRSEKFLFASTCENYASGFELGVVPVPSDEMVPLVVADVRNPRLSYAGSKIVGEQMTIFNAPGNYSFRIVRFHNVYGPRMGYAHVIPEVLKRIHQEETPFRVFGSDQTRAFCFVEDAVEQVIGSMRSAKAENEILHVGNSSEEVRISDVVKMIFDHLQCELPTQEVQAPNGSVNRRCPNIAKIQALTGVNPNVSLSEGLRRTVDWYWMQIQRGDVWE